MASHWCIYWYSLFPSELHDVLSLFRAVIVNASFPPSVLRSLIPDDGLHFCEHRWHHPLPSADVYHICLQVKETALSKEGQGLGDARPWSPGRESL